ncbi:MAG TPA: glutathione S-transferase N-terminal domain-containing protein [Polyangiaceae bacterium]|nr:glutathione S-transferase N-terminal domain-containing protein [Polyangiaceae bacterium]
MRLYGFRAVPTTWMALVTFAEKGHAPEFVSVDLIKGEHKLPGHTARHPFGLVPVLEDGGRLLYESRAIVRYLDRRLPGPSLTPDDPWAYGLMEQFISAEQCYYAPNVLAAFYDVSGVKPVDAATLAAAADATETALDVADAALRDGPYLAGGTFSLADITWMSFTGLLCDIGQRELVTRRPRLAAWWARVSERPSWAGLSRR